MIFDHIFLKFILVGTVNTFVGSAFMFALYNFSGFNYWVSSAANYFLTSILSFFLNKYFTFRVKRWSVRMIIAFVMTIIVSYLLAYSIAKPVMYWILGDSSQKIRDNISMLAGICLFTGLNYFGQRFVVFRKESLGREDNDD
ncbi:hypothetical protein AGMMS49991_10340 [Spirochaetia bacterium]|nr:hypothetical protein AGMMS49991_10340 [Spirochaetia bacterium]